MSIEADSAEDVGRMIRERRRMTGKALQYWDAMRGERPFPCGSEIASGAPAEIAPHLFTVSPGDDETPFRFTSGGAVLGALCGADPVGRPVADALPDEFSRRAASLMATAVQVGKPLADSGSFATEAGEEVLYRAVFMPLSGDQRRVDGLLGAISFTRRPVH